MTPHILFEDNHIILCKKPAGVPTQSGQIHTTDMVSLLTNYLNTKRSSLTNSKPPYLALINRLDQPVEGLLLFAKTPYAAKELNQQLAKGLIEKNYIALLSNKPKQDSGTLVNYLKKESTNNKSVIVSSQTVGAKKATLSYTIVEETATSTQVQIKLETGRHHQIRVQFAHIDCPIVGDQKYGTQITQRKPLCLCASSLSFSHPKTKEKICIKCTPSFL